MLLNATAVQAYKDRYHRFVQARIAVYDARSILRAARLANVRHGRADAHHCGPLPSWRRYFSKPRYAPKASPSFTGTISAAAFTGTAICKHATLPQRAATVPATYSSATAAITSTTIPRTRLSISRGRVFRSAVALLDRF
jgi:hypothetical protein